MARPKKSKYTLRKDGRVQKKITVVENGVKKYKTIIKNTDKELELYLDEIGYLKRKGIDIGARNDTFGEWKDKWLKLKKVTVSNGRYNTYLYRAENLAPLWGLPIHDIRTSDLQDIVIILASTPQKRTNKPYAKKTLIEIKQTASQIFEMAINNRVMEFNPANGIVIPKSAEANTKRALFDNEQKWIRSTEHRAKTAAMIFMYAGLRRGELIPLNWNDINLTENYIDICKAVEYINGQPIVKPTAKTKKSLRKVYITEPLVGYLKSLENKEGLVCVGVDGRMLTESAWKRLWDSYLAELNFKYGDFSDHEFRCNVKSRFAPEKIPFVIPRITPHWLRHTFITLMYLAGVDILTAMQQAGHEDIKTTMEIYTHLDNVYKKNSMAKFEEYVQNGVKTVSE